MRKLGETEGHRANKWWRRGSLWQQVLCSFEYPRLTWTCKLTLSYLSKVLGQTIPVCRPKRLWEVLSCPVIPNSSRRGFARCLLSDGPTAPVSHHLSQPPQPGQATPTSAVHQALPRSLVHGSSATGLSPHFTDEETEAQRDCLTVSQCQGRVWNPRLRIQCSFQLHRYSRSKREGRARDSKWVKRKDFLARGIAKCWTYSQAIIPRSFPES